MDPEIMDPDLVDHGPIYFEAWTSTKCLRRLEFSQNDPCVCVGADLSYEKLKLLYFESSAVHVYAQVNASITDTYIVMNTFVWDRAP